MNRTLVAAVAALATVALGAAGAQAQPKDEHHQGGGGRPQGGGQSHGGGAGHGGGQGHGGPPSGQGHGQGHGGQGPGQAPGGSQGRPPSHQGRPGGGNAPVTRPVPPQHGSGGHHSGNGGGRPGGGQFVYKGRPHAAIRGPSFSYPSGYGYRRWGVGQSLPLLFLTAPYFFNDYGTYGFGPPPYGYRWVRYGPDLLLVNLRTGRVRDVIYGAFY